jgi:hypothetical protein
MQKPLNWAQVQDLTGKFNDRPSYLKFKKHMVELFDALESQISLTKWGMKEAQRRCANDPTPFNLDELKHFQVSLRQLRRHASVVHAAIRTGKTRSIALAKASI